MHNQTYLLPRSINLKKVAIGDKLQYQMKLDVYALYKGTEKLTYVGETGNLRERINEINRTVNHSFSKQLGANSFGGIKSKKKFTDDIKTLLDIF